MILEGLLFLKQFLRRDLTLLYLFKLVSLISKHSHKLVTVNIRIQIHFLHESLKLFDIRRLARLELLQTTPVNVDLFYLCIEHFNLLVSSSQTLLGVQELFLEYGFSLLTFGKLLPQCLVGRLLLLKQIDLVLVLGGRGHFFRSKEQPLLLGEDTHTFEFVSGLLL